MKTKMISSTMVLIFCCWFRFGNSEIFGNCFSNPTLDECKEVSECIKNPQKKSCEFHRTVRDASWVECYAECSKQKGKYYNIVTRGDTPMKGFYCDTACQNGCIRGCDKHFELVLYSNFSYSCEFACFSTAEFRNECQLGCEAGKSKYCNYVDCSSHGPKKAASFDCNCDVRVEKVELLCFNANFKGNLPGADGKFFISLNTKKFDPLHLWFWIETRRQIEPGEIHGFILNQTEWAIAGDTMYPDFKIEKFELKKMHQLRVLGALPNGTIGHHVQTNWFNFPSDITLAPPPPTYVGLQRQYAHEGLIRAVVNWIPDKDYPSCYYLLSWWNNEKSEDRKFEIDQSFAYTIEKLEFGSNYTVVIRALSQLSYPWLESYPISFSFRTLTCLEAYEYDYDRCAPLPVRDLEALLVNVTSGDALIRWSPPKYLNPYNRISGYVISYKTAPTEHGCLNHTSVLNIFVNETENLFELSELVHGCTYIIRVSAESAGGIGEPAEAQLAIPSIERNDLNGDSGPSMNPLFLLFLIIPFVAIIVLIYFLYKFKKALPKKNPFDLFSSPSFQKYCVMKHVQRNSSYEPPSTIFSIQNAMTNFGGSLAPNELAKFYRIEQELGAGAFGCVYKAICRCPGLPYGDVAIKMLKENSSSSSESERHLKEEIRVLMNLPPHPHVVRVLAWYENPLCYVMEYCEMGNLKQFLKELRAKIEKQTAPLSPMGLSQDSGFWPSTISQLYEIPNFSQNKQNTEMNGTKSQSQPFDPNSPTTADFLKILQRYALQIAKAMLHLAKHGLIHRDLAARNVLVCRRGHEVKVSDFGLTRSQIEGAYHQSDATGRLPVKWMAPEAIFDRIFSEKTDIWSFGVVLWEICSIGKDPYSDIQVQEIPGLLKMAYRLPKPENCSDEIYVIMKNCWEFEPELRPTFSELVSKMELMLHKNMDYLTLDLPKSADDSHSE